MFEIQIKAFIFIIFFSFAKLTMADPFINCFMAHTKNPMLIPLVVSDVTAGQSLPLIYTARLSAFKVDPCTTRCVHGLSGNTAAIFATVCLDKVNIALSKVPVIVYRSICMSEPLRQIFTKYCWPLLVARNCPPLAVESYIQSSRARLLVEEKALVNVNISCQRTGYWCCQRCRIRWNTWSPIWYVCDHKIDRNGRAHPCLLAHAYQK